MEEAFYYREQAIRARRLASATTDDAIRQRLGALARQYEEIAEDLELGAIEVRHPELLQRRRQRGAETGGPGSSIT